MANVKLTAKTELAETPATGDLVHIVDVSDTTSDAGGTSKKITRANLVGGLFDTSTNDLDDITAGTTNKHFTSTDETKLDGVADGATADSAASIAETNTGTDTSKFVTPDGLAGSYAGTKSAVIVAFGPTTDVATGDGAAYVTLPSTVNGMNLVRAQATVVTAGTTGATTVQIHNVTDTVDMLSGAISIASGNKVGTVGTINTSNDDVATDDELRVDVDSVSTTAPKGLTIVLEFRLA